MGARGVSRVGVVPSALAAMALNPALNAEAKKNLRDKLKQGALRRADRDLGITQDWFNIDEESWQNEK